MCMVQVSNTLWAGLFGTLLGFKSILPVLVVQEPGAKEQVIFWNTRVNTQERPRLFPSLFAYNMYSIYNVQFYTQLIRDNMKNLKKAALGATCFAGNDFFSSINVFRKWWTMTFAAFGSPIGITSSPWVLQVIGNGPPWMQWQKGSTEATWESILQYVVRLRARNHLREKMLSMRGCRRIRWCCMTLNLQRMQVYFVDPTW